MHPLFKTVIQPYLRNPLGVLELRRRWRDETRFDTPFVFVLGPPRSGSTLLHRLLLNHPKIVGFENETALFSWHPVHEYRRFRSYVERPAYDAAYAETQSLAGFADALFRNSLDLPEGGRFVEKTPNHAKYLAYLLDRFPQARFILTMRDPRDTFCSGRSAGNIPQAKKPARHIEYFRKTVMPYLAARDTHADRVMLVRYEEFTRRPGEFLSEIMAFIGLDADVEQQLSVDKSGGDQRSERKPFTRLAQPITPATVGRWRDEMSAEEQAIFARELGPMLKELGYDAS